MKDYPWLRYDAEILEFNVAANINATFLAIGFDLIFQRNTSEKEKFVSHIFHRFSFTLVLSLLWEVDVRLTICGNEFTSWR